MGVQRGLRGEGKRGRKRGKVEGMGSREKKGERVRRRRKIEGR